MTVSFTPLSSALAPLGLGGDGVDVTRDDLRGATPRRGDGRQSAACAVVQHSFDHSRCRG